MNDDDGDDDDDDSFAVSKHCHFVPALSAVVVLGLVSAVPSQEVGWEEPARNDSSCVECDAEP